MAIPFLPRLIDRGGAIARLMLRHPSSAAAMATWKPFSITAFEMVRALRAQGIRPATVVDGGANIGQFSRATLETFPDCRVISFEPLPGAAERFRRNMRDEPRCRLIQAALGERNGATVFHAQDYDLASSVLPPVEGGPTATIEVDMTRLATALADATMTEPVLLKLDLQGYELKALRGADAILDTIRWILLEVGFRESYRGEASFGELYDFLRERGFVFRRPIDTLSTRGGEIVQMDALFEREG